MSEEKANTFQELHQLITDWETEHKKIPNSSDEELEDHIYESYACGLELIELIKELHKEYRKHFKVKEADVKKWMAETDD